MRAPPTSAPPHGEIARQRPAAAAGEAILADSAAAPVLLSAATAERVRTILVEGTSPATARAHAGDRPLGRCGQASLRRWP